MVEPNDGPKIFAVTTKAMNKHPAFFAAKPSNLDAIQYVVRKADEGDNIALQIADDFRKAGLL